MTRLSSFHVLALAATALASTPASAEKMQDFRVPAVDFSRLSSASDNAYNRELLAALQLDGIVALQNVPRYAELRETYLSAAAACAVTAQAQGAEFLLHRRLRDDTNRYTVSLESGRALRDVLAESDELRLLCPEYVEVHQTFSEAVELAVANVGSALDATQSFEVVTEGGESVMLARQLLEESVHLDHFHAYEAAHHLAGGSNGADDTVDLVQLSLELHTDNGLMIAMTAPEYFDVLESGEVQKKATREEDAGLIIQTASGDMVRPVLKADELVLMLGSGIDQWLETTPPLHAVLHGMKYPRGVSSAGEGPESKLLRAWFGKMVLLEAHQVMANTGMTYGQYANQTTRYLVESDAEDREAFAAVACPPQRHLAASDGSCSLKMCQLKSSASSSDLKHSCQITCNHDATSDAALCEQYCDCEDAEATGTTCWMLCVENFSSDVCPGEQQCNKAFKEEELAMKCVDGTVAPSTSTSTSSITSSTSSTASSGSSSASTTTTTAPSATTTTPSTTTTTPSATTSAPSATTAASSTSSTEGAPESAGSAGSVDSTTKISEESAAGSSTDASSSFSSSGASLAASMSLCGISMLAVLGVLLQ